MPYSFCIIIFKKTDVWDKCCTFSHPFKTLNAVFILWSVKQFIWIICCSFIWSCKNSLDSQSRCWVLPGFPWPANPNTHTANHAFLMWQGIWSGSALFGSTVQKFAVICLKAFSLPLWGPGWAVHVWADLHEAQQSCTLAWFHRCRCQCDEDFLCTSATYACFIVPQSCPFAWVSAYKEPVERGAQPTHTCGCTHVTCWLADSRLGVQQEPRFKNTVWKSQTPVDNFHCFNTWVGFSSL